jgi:hypothetical protein
MRHRLWPVVVVEVRLRGHGKPCLQRFLHNCNASRLSRPFRVLLVHQAPMMMMWLYDPAVRQLGWHLYKALHCTACCMMWCWRAGSVPLAGLPSSITCWAVPDLGRGSVSLAAAHPCSVRSVDWALEGEV